MGATQRQTLKLENERQLQDKRRYQDIGDHWRRQLEPTFCPRCNSYLQAIRWCQVCGRNESA